MSGNELKVGVVQCALGGSREQNVARVLELVREAAGRGAEVISPPELFEGPYFCRHERDEFFAWARPLAGHDTLERVRALCRELGVVVPVSLFERAGHALYNSVAVVDADGEVLGVYRKSHIPDGPGYLEKYYFRPGDTGFKVWSTKHGAIGVGICWDQWYPEAARCMVLQGAEILFYPTAIGSEPQDPTLDTHLQWQRAMQGHAVANAIPIVAANRIGVEENDGTIQSYYGHSFIADHKGELVASFGDKEEGVLVHEFDLDATARYRAEWGFFRDRRTDLYAKHIL